jgi:hypothetical protein
MPIIKEKNFTITLPISLGTQGEFQISSTQLNNDTCFLVIAYSCLDQNGVPRIVDCTTTDYNRYITRVQDAVAVNGHVRLFDPYLFHQNKIDSSCLLGTGIDYRFDLLSGVIGNSTEIFITLIAFT